MRVLAGKDEQAYLANDGIYVLDTARLVWSRQP
jgi:hypothetical protein